MQERLNLIMPKGEIQNVTFDALKKIGMDFTVQGKNYRTRVNNWPVDLTTVRASDVPDAVLKERNSGKAGITGSDILWNYGLNRGNVGTEVPLFVFDPNLVQPKLYLGVTESLTDEVALGGRTMKPKEISGSRLVTKYPVIADDYLKDRDINNVDVIYLPGSIEGWQYVDPNAKSLIDIWVSGRTARDNKISPVELFSDVSTRLFENPDKLTGQEQRILDEVREGLYIEGKRMETPMTAFV